MEKNKKIKLVLAINDFTMAGAQRLYLDMLDFFDRSEYEVTLVSLFQFSEKKNFYDFVPKWVSVEKLNFKNFYDFKKWAELFSFLSKTRPDVVISSLFFCNTIFRVLKPFLGYKIITIEHNTYINKTKKEILVDKLLSFITYKIVAVSKTVAEFTARQEKIQLKKFTVINNGININRIKNQIKNAGELSILRCSLASPAEKIILNVGRLTTQKNQEALIRAFVRFAGDFPNYKLIILGDGSHKDRLREIVEHASFSDKIILAGEVENVVPYYLISDFFVSVSFIEGFGLAHVEALCCGLPVLTTKTAGPDEFIKEGENGFFIEKDEQSIYEGLKKMSGADLKVMGDRIRKSVEGYSIEVTAKKYKLLIKRSLGDRN